MIVVTIIVFLLILGLLIFVHEAGHFATARFFGVKVEEFGMGFPPRIFAFRRGETEYSLNMIPLGGFCKLLGEEDPSAPGSLAADSGGHCQKVHDTADRCGRQHPRSSYGQFQ